MKVELSDATFERLQKHATPLVDSIDSVIERLLDSYEAQRPVGESVVAPFDAAVPPDLTHTKVLSASIAGQHLLRPNWNTLMLAAVRIAVERAQSHIELRRFVAVPFVRTKKDDEGYTWHPDIGLSIQGQDANSSWRATHHVATLLNVPVHVEFVWRQKEAAAFPGRMGTLDAPRAVRDSGAA